jgi:hypothetical protein
MMTLADLLAAYTDGTLSRDSDVLRLDNDDVSLYDATDRKVFESHPHTLLREALDLLGVPWEDV